MIIWEESLDEAPAVAARYSRVAPLYNGFTDYEMVHHRKAAELADLRPDARVLDVACGTGRGLAALSDRLDPDTVRYGVDLTPEMLQRAARRMARLGLAEVTDLRVGRADALPFPDGHFDLVYSGYFFDLVKLEAVAPLLQELKRVLRPGGQLVLVNMSKAVAGTTRYERLYRERKLGPFSGSCRPVLMAQPVKQAGFEAVSRYHFRNRSLFWLNKMFTSEIVTARKA